MKPVIITLNCGMIITEGYCNMYKELGIRDQYPTLWAFVKDVYGYFADCEVDGDCVERTITSGLCADKRPEQAATSFSFRCGICGKCCKYSFLIGDEKMVTASSLDFIELEKREQFYVMGKKFEEHCPYASK
jgi:hypothetical protein